MIGHSTMFSSRRMSCVSGGTRLEGVHSPHQRMVVPLERGMHPGMKHEYLVHWVLMYVARQLEIVIFRCAIFLLSHKERFLASMLSSSISYVSKFRLPLTSSPYFISLVPPPSR